MELVSIIIRTKNEERWIAHCLDMVFKQTYRNFEVILVDNESDDHTVAVARRFPIASFVSISNFRPGLAINEGIRASKGQYIVCLSAHCIPKQTDWLEQLVSNLSDEKVAGAYGRQLPVSFTDAVDKRDLLIVFGQDRRVQVKDYFFHNANSIFRRDIWEKFEFDEEVTNIEDRVWGKVVTNAGYHLIYDPLASVFHHHGLHQGNNPKRANGVVSIIEQVDSDIVNQLPESLRPETANIAAFVPIQGKVDADSIEHQLIVRAIEGLKSAKYVDNIYLISTDASLAEKFKIRWIDRELLPDVDNLSIDEVLGFSLEIVESREDYPVAVLYVNYQYPIRPDGLYDELIVDAQYKGYDTVFPGYLDFGHYWHQNDNMEFIEIDSSMASRQNRQPIVKALYGLGCLVSVAILRTRKIVGGKIGILELDDIRTTLNLKDHGTETIYKALSIIDSGTTPDGK